MRQQLSNFSPNFPPYQAPPADTSFRLSTHTSTHTHTHTPRGFKRGSVTELVGPAGVGKTQHCMQAALHCILPPSLNGLGATCVYIDTENKLVLNRIDQMCQHRYPDFYQESVQHSQKGKEAISSSIWAPSSPSHVSTRDTQPMHSTSHRFLYGD